MIPKLFLYAVALVATVSILGLLNCQRWDAEAVIVDGKRKGPSALKNQSHAEDMIDGYNTKTCGINDPDKKQSEFVNNAKEGQFPWLVSFQVAKKDDPNLRPFLDNNKMILTGGSTDVHNPKNLNFTIKRIFYHKKFDRSSPIGFDVSLIEVSEKAPIKTKREDKVPYINTVCLPIEGKEYKEGQAVKLAGWGDTESKDSKSKPEHLMTTDLLVTNGEQCANIFSKKLGKVKHQYHNYKDFICADYHGERDACQGDSGASLLMYADGKAVCVGIVSYGLGCATKGVPGVYTRTSTFMPWIKDIIQNKENATVEHILLSPTSDKKGKS